MRTLLVTLAATALLADSTGCSLLIAGLAGNVTGSDGVALMANMDKYDVDAIDVVFDGTPTHWCPGESRSFKVVAQARDHKKNHPVTLETATEFATAKEKRGKMDLIEFAMEGRGGKVSRGVFTADYDPFASLLGYDVRAKYRNDPSKQVELHFEPSYACIGSIGASGATGQEGQSGYDGAEPGQGGSNGGAGGDGGPGPRVQAYVTIVRTPKYERVGLARVTDGADGITLFDLEAGITIYARGGTGGRGGFGGAGAQGADPQGAGGFGGNGGPGGNGGDGGAVSLVIDDRYPELAKVVRIDVSGGEPGYGGDGGYGGAGGPAPERACDTCDDPPPGPEGTGGAGGPGGTASGRPGISQVLFQDLTRSFGTLPPGVVQRDDPRRVAAPTTPPPAPGGGRKKPRPRR